MARKTQDAPATVADTRAHQTKIASKLASRRLSARLDEGGERVGLEVKTTGDRRNTRLPISGMTDRELTIRLADALGTTSPEFIDAMLVNLLTYFNAPTDRRATREINSALAVLDGLKPENEVEAMLIAQMVATNDAAMRCLSLIGSVNGAETFGNLAVKMMRTFTSQAEVLAKLRRKGEQTVRVVHVHPGGQAVVGDVHNHPTGGRGQITESGDQSDAAGNSSAGAALPSPNAIGETLPVTSRRRSQKVPDARRHKSGRAQGQPA